MLRTTLIALRLSLAALPADEMREIIRRKLEEEGLLPPQVEHEGLVREVDEQRHRCR
jgi:hypothetical protein